MQKQSLHDLIEFDNHRFHPQVLINEPGYRMVLLSLRAGQSVPEHSTPGKVTVYAIRGHVTFHEGSDSCELRVGDVVSIEPGAPHRVYAQDDSALLVLATAKAASVARSTDIPETRSEIQSEELDLSTIPRSERHPLIFSVFDALAVGSSMRLLNDHDPIPLNRQFESIRPGQAAWEYIERGPNLFRIRIRRIAAPDPLDVPLGAPPQHVQIEPSRTIP